MRTILMASAAAALAIMPAQSLLADPGGGNGGGNKGGGQKGGGQHGGGQHGGGGQKGGGQKGGGNGGAHKQGGGGQGHAKPMQASKGNGGGNGGGGKGNGGAKHASAPSQQGKGNGNGNDGGKDRGGPVRFSNGNGHGNGGGNGNGRSYKDHGPGVAVKAEKGPKFLGKDKDRMRFVGASGREFFVPANDRVRIVTDRGDWGWARGNSYRSFDGCPPGLAKKYNGCNPPGLVRTSYDNSYDWYRPTWYGFDDGYRYFDGYMLRTSGTSILSYIPLLGGALGLGQMWPGAYEPVSLPPYYNDYYDLGGPDSWRYYGDTIYRVDPRTSQIDSIAALLTGDDFLVGQAMPMGYDVYNVPYGYRDQYMDGPDALYRYDDGYIYQVDPTTRLVQAAIELLL